jgi:hypothetical protein
MPWVLQLRQHWCLQTVTFLLAEHNILVDDNPYSCVGYDKNIVYYKQGRGRGAQNLIL